MFYINAYNTFKNSILVFYGGISRRWCLKIEMIRVT